MLDEVHFKTSNLKALNWMSESASGVETLNSLWPISKHLSIYFLIIATGNSFSECVTEFCEGVTEKVGL